VSGRFLPNNFSEPLNTTKPSCDPNPGNSTSDTGGFISWSHGASTASDDFTNYDKAIRFTMPLFVAVWLKDTMNEGFHVGQVAWSDSRVMCIPGNTTVEGSRNITQADADAGAERVGGMNLVALMGLVVSIGLLV
jgi:hypothetical protein